MSGVTHQSETSDKAALPAAGRHPEQDAEGGFHVNVSRQLDLPRAAVFAGWADETRRARWLRRGDFEPTAVREPDTVRGKWMPDGSRVDVDLSEAGEGICALSITHRQIASEEDAARMRQFWEQSLDRFAERFGPGK